MTIAFVGFSYGRDYQRYLPMYADSVLRLYPEATLLLYIEGPIVEEVKSLLASVRQQHRADIRVRDGYTFGVEQSVFRRLHPKGKRALRWLFYEEEFSEFDHIYLGDIDMLMLPETLALETAHSEHAMAMGTPYSNYIRVRNKKAGISTREFLGHVKRLNGRSAVLSLRKEPPTALRRLTGLHFVRSAEYYPQVIPFFDEFKCRIQDPMYVRITDERVLYDLVSTAGLPLPPISSHGPDLDPAHTWSAGFRPHHGIHLGIFRSADPMTGQAQVLESYVYADYFKSYQALREDAEWQKLLQSSGPILRKQLKVLDQFIGEREG